MTLPRKAQWLGALVGGLALLSGEPGKALSQSPAPAVTLRPILEEVATQEPWVPVEKAPRGDRDGGGSNQRDNQELTDLTLGNFFSAGWNEDWAKRRRSTGTPDLALLRVQTNFLEREFRMNYFFVDNIHRRTRQNLHDIDALIAWGFNRRFMIQVFGNFQWIEARRGRDLEGGTPSLVGRVQLIDTEPSSYSFNFRAVAPNVGIGEHQTILSYGLAGFEDLAYWFGLDRVGLYHSIFFDTLAGPHERGVRQNDVAYVVTLAKTLTSPKTPLLGTFTAFVENFAQTDLDGEIGGRTLVTITPGARFNLGKSDSVKFGKDNWIILGADIPVSGPKPWDVTYRFTYIKNF